MTALAPASPGAAPPASTARRHDREVRRGLRVDPAPATERAALEQDGDGGVDLLSDRAVEHDRMPLGRQQPRRADPGRTARSAPGPRPEIGGRHSPEEPGSDRLPAWCVDLAGIAQALGHREHGREVDLHFGRAVVELELQAEGGPGLRALQSPHPAGEGEVEELGHLGSHLARLAVERVAARQHQVERTRQPQRGRQGARRRQGVGAGERRVAQMDPRVGPPGHGFAQHVFGTRRPEGDDGARAPGDPGQLDPLRHRSAAVGVELETDPVAHQPAVGPEAELLGHRDLFDQGGHAQRPSEPRSRVHLVKSSRSGRGPAHPRGLTR